MVDSDLVCSNIGKAELSTGSEKDRKQEVLTLGNRTCQLGSKRRMDLAKQPLLPALILPICRVREVFPPRSQYNTAH